MKILVCVKQVVDSESPIRIDESAQWVQTDSSSFRMNRFDEFAVEEAVLIKENFSDITIDVISVGPTRSVMAIRRALGMGADHGIHIFTEQQGYRSPFVIASWISSYARNKNYELILAGAISEDEMQGQVGQLVAEFLSLPCASSTIFEQLSPGKGTVYVEREMEGGFRDTLELRLPAVLTVQSGINKPRYPSLSNLLRAKRQQMETLDPSSFEHPDPRQWVVGVGYPHKLRSGMMLTGTQQEKAAQLLKILREKALIR